MSYTRDWTENAPWEYTTARNIPGPYAETVKGNAVFSSARSGEKVDGWREKIAKGDLAASPYSLNATRIDYMESGSAQMTYTHSYWGKTYETFSGVYRSPVSPTQVPIPVDVSNKALARILRKVRNEYEHTSVLPALAELRSTVRQFGAPASAILSLSNRHLNKLALAARGLSGSVAFKKVAWHRIVASTYLEYAFFLKPLLGDVREAAEALARWNAEAEGELPRPTSVYLRASADSETHSQTIPNSGWVGGFATNIGFKDVYQEVHRFGVRYWVKLSNSLQADFGSNDRLLQLLGFDPAQFAPTVWEVIPWSWLFDYFLNVQEVLEAGVTRTSNIEWIVRTERVNSTRTYEGVASKRDLVGGSYPSTWTSSKPFLGRWRTTRTLLNRTLPASLGIPSLTVSYPDTVTKIANTAAALFARRSQSHPLWLF